MRRLSNLKLFVVYLLFCATFLLSCSSSKDGLSVLLPIEPIVGPTPTLSVQQKELVLGNQRMDVYLPFLSDAKVALVVNQTSFIDDTHLVDTLLELGVQIEKIFALEHGYRGQAANGEVVDDSIDPITGLEIVSLYGKHKKPTAADLDGIDYVVFDIQDVGVRFYTYISSMHYIMEACGEEGVGFIVLDRPNPNGHYFDGPVLEGDYMSFVGKHEIPVVHGLTVGELAWMINDMEWTTHRCELFIVPCLNYNHNTFFQIPIKPSPNLPNMASIYLYPSLCFFEGTVVSVGRGTDSPFQRFGHPYLSVKQDSFIPAPNIGSKFPKHEGQLCYGQAFNDFSTIDLQNHKLDLSYMLDVYESFPVQDSFFLANNFFDLLAGNKTLRNQIKDHCSIEEITASWKKDLAKYAALRKRFLIYPDFTSTN